MPTRHRRVAVPRDPEVERALRRTRPLLDRALTRSAAAHVRALALRGARALAEERGGERARIEERIQRRHGAIPARIDIRDIPPPGGAVDPADPSPASDALSWVRGE